MTRRDMLLGSFHEVQKCSGANWLPVESLKALGSRFKLSAAGIRSIASYYSMLSLKPRGRHIVRLCVSPVCRMLGALDLLDTVRIHLGIEPGETDREGAFTLETVQCLGRCASSPAMMVDERVFGSLTSDSVRSVLDRIRDADADSSPAASPAVSAAPVPALAPAPVSALVSPVFALASALAADIGPSRDNPAHAIALRYPGLRNPADIDEYSAAGGYTALRIALARNPLDIVDELVRAKLRGRGGAGFPAGLKERSSAATACSDADDCERYVVCNADEGEPGTFKDRLILEREPHLVIEGMIISGYAIGSRRGYIYIRGEYTEAIARMSAAIESARRAGILGSGFHGDANRTPGSPHTGIFGSGFFFDIELRTGAGSYLCGEELTLLESLEGKRGYPRIKPPFPAESGLWGKPTLVNNVETLAVIPWIVEKGTDSWLKIGTPGSPGTKLFCISGDVAHPGYGEWELGVTLGTLVAAAGGVVAPDGAPAEKPATILLGGAAGTFVSGDEPDMVIDYDSLRNHGATLGSGAVIVLGPDRSISCMISSIMDFFRHESCGKCVPCRVGTVRLAEKATRLAEKAADCARISQDSALPADAARKVASRTLKGELLDDMVRDAEMIAKTSLCPLGQSPAISLKSAALNLADRL